MTKCREEVINIKKKYLNQKGYRDLEHWLEDPNHLYIGRNMTFYVSGATQSKWRNPFSVKKYGREGCLNKYREYIQNHPTLLQELEELQNKTLGCWCHPDPCHGDILLELLNAEKKPNLSTENQVQNRSNLPNNHKKQKKPKEVTNL